MVEIKLNKTTDLAEEIRGKFDASRKRKKVLDDRMESDYALYVLDAYYQAIEKHQKQDNESLTSNSPSVLGNKVIDYLSDGDIKYSVSLEAKPRKETREKCSNNELLAYAMTEEAERNWQSYPEHTFIQGEVAFHVSIRGWICGRLLVYEEDDILIGDLAPWDPLNTFWGTGKGGLAWAGFERYASVEEIDETYNFKPTPDSLGRVKVYDYWNRKEESIILEHGSTKKNRKVLDERAHNLGYVPCYIKPCGAVPLIQGGSKHTDDAIKFLGESLYQNNRSIYPIENEMLTYYRNCVAMGVMLPKVLWTKGTVLDNPFAKNPYQSNGAVIKLNTDQYEKLEDFIKPAMPSDTAGFMSLITGLKNSGGLPPISFGDIAQQQTAQGVNILNHNALTTLKPRQKAMEQFYSWVANEFVSQFVKGEYPQREFTGLNSKNKQYQTKIGAEDLEPSRKVKATLKLNLPQDAEINLAVTLQKLKADIISRLTAMDEQGVQDPDAEQATIDREKGRQILGLDLFDALDEIMADSANGSEKEQEQKKRMALLVKSRVDQMFNQIAQEIRTGGRVEPQQGGAIPDNPQLAMRGRNPNMLSNREQPMNPAARLAGMGLTMGRR